MRRRVWWPDTDRTPSGERLGCVFVPVAVLAFFGLTLLLSWCQEQYGGESLLYVNLLLLLSWLVIGPLYLLLRVLERERQRAAGDDLPALGEASPLRPPSRPPVTRSDAEMDIQMTDAGEAAPVCPYCRYPITATESRLNCPRCETPHHRECWQANGGCTTYGCRQNA